MQKLITLDFNPTTNTAGGAHTAGDALASLLTIDLGALRHDVKAPIFLTNVLITDLDAQNHDVDLILLDTNPTNTTVTGNTALDIHDTDLLTVMTVVNVDDYAAFADNGVHFATELSVPIQLNHAAATPTIYGILVTRGTPTYSSTAAIRVRLTFMAEMG